MTPADNPVPLPPPPRCPDGNLAGYDAICAEAERLTWPRLWADDLFIADQERLSGTDVPLEFGWAVRETGTFLLFPGNVHDLDLAHALLANRDKNVGWPDQRYYWFDGTVLTALSLEDLIKQLQRYRV